MEKLEKPNLLSLLKKFLQDFTIQFIKNLIVVSMSYLNFYFLFKIIHFLSINRISKNFSVVYLENLDLNSIILLVFSSCIFPSFQTTFKLSSNYFKIHLGHFYPFNITFRYKIIQNQSIKPSSYLALIHPKLFAHQYYYFHILTFTN